jgi:hypothetical protein
VPPRRLDRQRPPGRFEYRSRAEPALGLVGPDVDDDVTADAVGTADLSDQDLDCRAPLLFPTGRDE